MRKAIIITLVLACIALFAVGCQQQPTAGRGIWGEPQKDFGAGIYGQDDGMGIPSREMPGYGADIRGFDSPAYTVQKYQQPAYGIPVKPEPWIPITFSENGKPNFWEWPDDAARRTPVDPGNLPANEMFLISGNKLNEAINRMTAQARSEATPTDRGLVVITAKWGDQKSETKTYEIESTEEWKAFLKKIHML